jgi:hypothetical protein
LDLSDEEDCSYYIASHSELRGSNTLGSNWFTSTKTTDDLVGLDELTIKFVSFLKNEYDIKLIIAPPSMSV